MLCKSDHICEKRNAVHVLCQSPLPEQLVFPQMQPDWLIISGVFCLILDFQHLLCCFDFQSMASYNLNILDDKPFLCLVFDLIGMIAQERFWSPLK